MGAKLHKYVWDYIDCQLGKTFLGFDIDKLLYISKTNVGYEFFYSTEFIEPLTYLTKAIDRYANLSLRGRQMVKWWIINCLSNRLCIDNYLMENPSARDECIVAPTIVVGLPRSGTTFLYNLLSQDDGYQWIKAWEAAMPVWPSKFGPDMRRKITIERFRQQDVIAPEIRNIHNSEADGPEECQVLLQNTFECEIFPLTLRIPAYSEWLNKKSRAESYKFYLQQLKIFQHHRGRNPWLLKSPTHMFSLGDLLEVVPDARIVFIQRDPAETLPSACSLSYALRRQFSNFVSKHEIGLEMKRQFEIADLKAKSVICGLPTKQVAIVKYTDFINDPMSAIDNIYDKFERKLTKSSRHQMSSYSQIQSTMKRPAHIYSLSEFGLEIPNMKGF